MTGRLRMVCAGVLCLAAVGIASVSNAQGPLTSGGGANGPYTPPACVPGVPFSDITCTTGFDPWIEQFALDGITAGCGGGLYCPGTPVTRDQMAVFIEKSMRGTANWPPRLSQVYAVLNTDGSVDTNASGDLLRSAILAIPTTGPAVPTSINHWLVKVGPGRFLLGSSGLSLPPYVDLAGSGQETTIIVSTAIVGGIAAIDCAGTSTISDLSVSNVGGSTNSRAIHVTGGKLTLDRVVATAYGGSSENKAILVNDGGLEMRESEATATGANAMALYLQGVPSNPAVDIRNSYFYGATWSIWNVTNATVRLITSRFYGALHTNADGGTYQCFQNYDYTTSGPITCP